MSVISLVKVSDLLGPSSTLHLLFEVVNKQVLPKEKTDMHGVNLLLFSGGNRVTRRNYTCQQSVKTTKFIWLVEFWRQTVKLLRSRVWWDSKAMKMLTARPLCCHWGGGGIVTHCSTVFFKVQHSHNWGDVKNYPNEELVTFFSPSSFHMHSNHFNSKIHLLCFENNFLFSQ